MANAYAKINPDNIRWARLRANLTEGMLARKLDVDEERIAAWEAGEKPITFKQAKKIADKTYVPFGFLFLKHTPEERLPIPDLRTKEGEEIKRPSAELLKIIQIILARQNWFKDYLNQQGSASVPYVGKFSLSSSATDIVSDMKNALEIPEHPTRGSWEDYQRDLVKRIESLGILVMRHGDLGHFTKALSVEEFRGFAIVDKACPIIFVNQADTPSARLFTLIHELAHIWIGQSGISDGGTNPHRKEEILCNAVAAEFLVPGDEFQKLWDKHTEWTDNLPPLEAHFHVSQWVLARRALTLNFISQEQYVQFTEKLKRLYKERESSGSPSFYKTKRSQISEQFSRALIAEALSGRVLLRDASALLGMKPNQVFKFAEELGI